MSAAAISAAAMRCRTMADGSLRIEVEVEPTDAQAAFVLFGKPGAPMALAALMPGHAQADKAPKPAPAKRPTGDGGHLWSKWAALRCQDPRFWRWIENHDDGGDGDNRPRLRIRHAEDAAQWVRNVCEVDSRAEFDADPAAYQRFVERVKAPWQKHYLASGWAE